MQTEREVTTSHCCFFFNITGHGAFSDQSIVNDIVGLIIHSALLTPFYSWKISHRKHHSNTGSCENDEAFVPFTEDEVKQNWSDIVQDSPLFILLKIMFFLLLGWMPVYLGFNNSKMSPNSCHFVRVFCL